MRSTHIGWRDAAEVADALDHMPAPLPICFACEVALTPGTHLHGPAGTAAVEVNSLHRQTITGQGNFTIAGCAPDGLIGEIEGPGWPVGLQWRPEYGLSTLDRAIFKDFIAARSAA